MFSRFPSLSRPRRTGYSVLAPFLLLRLRLPPCHWPSRPLVISPVEPQHATNPSVICAASHFQRFFPFPPCLFAFCTGGRVLRHRVVVFRVNPNPRDHDGRRETNPNSHLSTKNTGRLISPAAASVISPPSITISVLRMEH